MSRLTWNDLESVEDIKTYTTRGLLEEVRIINLPAWDMDTAISVSVSIGASGSKGFDDLVGDGYLRILGASCRIVDDLGRPSVSPKDISFDWTKTTFTISRVSGGKYDTADYNATDSSRGLLILRLSL